MKILLYDCVIAFGFLDTVGPLLQKSLAIIIKFSEQNSA